MDSVVDAFIFCVGTLLDEFRRRSLSGNDVLLSGTARCALHAIPQFLYFLRKIVDIKSYLNEESSPLLAPMRSARENLLPGGQRFDLYAFVHRTIFPIGLRIAPILCGKFVLEFPPSLQEEWILLYRVLSDNLLNSKPSLWGFRVNGQSNGNGSGSAGGPLLITAGPGSVVQSPSSLAGAGGVDTPTPDSTPSQSDTSAPQTSSLSILLDQTLAANANSNSNSNSNSNNSSYPPVDPADPEIAQLISSLATLGFQSEVVTDAISDLRSRNLPTLLEYLQRTAIVTSSAGSSTSSTPNNDQVPNTIVSSSLESIPVSPIAFQQQVVEPLLPHDNTTTTSSSGNNDDTLNPTTSTNEDINVGNGVSSSGSADGTPQSQRSETYRDAAASTLTSAMPSGTHVDALVHMANQAAAAAEAAGTPLGSGSGSSTTPRPVEGIEGWLTQRNGRDLMSQNDYRLHPLSVTRTSTSGGQSAQALGRLSDIRRRRSDPDLEKTITLCHWTYKRKVMIGQHCVHSIYVKSLFSSNVYVVMPIRSTLGVKLVVVTW
jgi:hypothetical protein